MFGRGLKIYSVYIKPDADYPHETAEFVEEHASIWGVVFHLFWCFYHKLWIHGVVLAVLWNAVIIGGSEMGLSVFSIAAFELFIRLIVMFDGNNWRQARLKRKGYILADVVSGAAELEAKQRFFERWLASKPDLSFNEAAPAKATS